MRPRATVPSFGAADGRGSAAARAKDAAASRARVGARWRRRKTARPPDRIAYLRRRAPGARASGCISRIFILWNRLHDKDPEAHSDASPRPSRPSPDPTGTAMTDVTAATTPLVGGVQQDQGVRDARGRPGARGRGRPRVTGEPLARRDHPTRRPPSNSSPHDLRSPRPPILAAASQRKPMTEIMDRTAYQRPSSFSEVRPRPDASPRSIDDGLPHARFSFFSRFASSRGGRGRTNLEPPTDVFHRARSRAPFLFRLDPIRPPDASRRT